MPFPVQRRVRPDFKFRIKAYDTILPPDDPNEIQRRLELDQMRLMYQYSAKDKEFPGMIAEVPDDEKFSMEYFMVKYID